MGVRGREREKEIEREKKIEVRVRAHEKGNGAIVQQDDYSKVHGKRYSIAWGKTRGM